ncbi:ArnT family glycosyltransferase [Neobacillus vireti]|uniref:ArnT family glycosyltransferase n=1 Tax=Neobacillus vireti TaxID=220686 RepID=UPI002FFE712C
MNNTWKETRLFGMFNEKLTVFLFFYSFFIMLFFTQTSPFFVITEWVDSNAFFTVGKGMANGLIPYRDLFEQKGPLLYGIHAIAYWISHTTFLGVYIFESLAMFANLILAFKIARLYFNWMPSAIISIFFPLLILNQQAFRFGDSAEEFSIPFLMTLLYLILKYFKKDSVSLFKWPIYLLNGIMIGCVFWIKFTLVGAWIGFYLAILFICVGEKKWKELIKAILFTIVGLVLSSFPWFIYFGMNHALKDFLDVYLKFNIFMYSSQTNLIEKLVKFAITFGSEFNRNFESKVLITIGLLDFLFTWKYLKVKGQKWMLISTIIFLITGVYIGGQAHRYSFLIITPLGLMGLLAIGHYLQNAKMQLQIHMNNTSRWFALFLVALTTIFMCFGYNVNMNSSRLYIKAPLAQQTFARIMNQEPHPTLLNYGTLDGGFYTVANILPNIRYFEMQNIDYSVYPENRDEQNRYIKEKMIQFVVIRGNPAMNPNQLQIPYLHENYHLVSQQNQNVEGLSYKFFLFKLN